MPTTIKNRLTKWSNLVHNLSCPYRQKDPTKHNNLRQNGNNGATKHGEVRTAMADPRNQRSWKAEISTDQNPNPVAFNTLHEFLCDSPGVAHVDRVAMPRILDFLQLYVEMITWQVPFWDHSTALCQNPTANPLFGGYECLWYSPNGSKCFMSVFFPTPQVLIFHSPGSLCFHWAVARDDVSHETSLLHAVMILHTWILQSQRCHWFGYGSIPINTIFRGMNIHLPAILMFTRGTRFWHTAIWQVMECILKWRLWSNGKKSDDKEVLTTTQKMTIIIENDNKQLWKHILQKSSS